MKEFKKKESPIVPKNEETQLRPKETFEPLEIKEVDVKVEKGYATSGNVNDVTITPWSKGTW